MHTRQNIFQIRSIYSVRRYKYFYSYVVWCYIVLIVSGGTGIRCWIDRIVISKSTIAILLNQFKSLIMCTFVSLSKRDSIQRHAKGNVPKRKATFLGISFVPFLFRRSFRYWLSVCNLVFVCMCECCKVLCQQHWRLIAFIL